MVYNQPLAERLSDLSGIAWSTMQKHQLIPARRRQPAVDKYPHQFTEYNIGSDRRKTAVDETLAKHDAVIMASPIAPQRLVGAYHAKMIEALGTPTV